MISWPNFSPEEFERACPPCKLEDMQLSFMNRLQTARDLAGVPFRINSAYRSKSYELKKGRSGSSMHCLGRAADIRCSDGRTRYRIVEAAVKAGFRGIGIGKTFVHLDDRDENSNIWLYD